MYLTFRGAIIFLGQLLMQPYLFRALALRNIV